MNEKRREKNKNDFENVHVRVLFSMCNVHLCVNFSIKLKTNIYIYMRQWFARPIVLIIMGIMDGKQCNHTNPKPMKDNEHFQFVAVAVVGAYHYGRSIIWIEWQKCKVKHKNCEFPNMISKCERAEDSCFEKENTQAHKILSGHVESAYEKSSKRTICRFGQTIIKKWSEWMIFLFVFFIHPSYCICFGFSRSHF